MVKYKNIPFKLYQQFVYFPASLQTKRQIDETRIM